MCCGFLPPTLLHIPSYQPGRSQVTFRKKPPRKVRRDCKKAEKRQKARTDQASVLEASDYSVSLSMPTQLLKKKHQKNDIDSRPAGKQLHDSAHVECDNRTWNPRERVDDCFLQLCEPDPEPDPERDPEAKIRGKGYNIEEIRDYVRRLTEHPDRNRHINRFVCTSFDNKPYLVCD